MTKNKKGLVCPVCSTAIDRLHPGGLCPNKECSTDGLRTKLHRLTDRFILYEDKERADMIFTTFEQLIAKRNKLTTFNITGRTRQLEYVAIYLLMDKVNEIISQNDEGQFIGKIFWYDVIYDLLVVSEREFGPFAQKLTSIRSYTGTIFVRLVPDIYNKHKQRILRNERDIQTIEKTHGLIGFENGLF